MDFTQSKTYEKFGKVKFRYATENEVVTTFIDGNIETTNVANAGDAIITGPKNEEYIVPSSKFHQKYEVTAIYDGGWGYANPLGVIDAIQVTDENFLPELTTSWGKMTVTKGGYYAKSGDEVYFIDEGVFNQTYRLKTS